MSNRSNMLAVNTDSELILASHEPLSGSELVTNLNTDADQHDDDGVPLGSSTNDATGSSYYFPSSDGIKVGNMNSMFITLALTNTAFDIELSNDQSTWINATKSSKDVTAASDGHDNTYYVSTGSTPASFGVDISKLHSVYFRLVSTPNNATNSFAAVGGRSAN